MITSQEAIKKSLISFSQYWKNGNFGCTNTIFAKFVHISLDLYTGPCSYAASENLPEEFRNSIQNILSLIL